LNDDPYGNINDTPGKFGGPYNPWRPGLSDDPYNVTTDTPGNFGSYNPMANVGRGAPDPWEATDDVPGVPGWSAPSVDWTGLPREGDNGPMASTAEDGTSPQLKYSVQLAKQMAYKTYEEAIKTALVILDRPYTPLTAGIVAGIARAIVDAQYDVYGQLVNELAKLFGDGSARSGGSGRSGDSSPSASVHLGVPTMRPGGTETANNGGTSGASASSQPSGQLGGGLSEVRDSPPARTQDDGAVVSVTVGDIVAVATPDGGVAYIPADEWQMGDATHQVPEDMQHP
jgi:hypothetical protein